MLEILVVLSYLFVGLFIILKMDFFKITGVQTSYLLAVFLLKCGFGFLLYYVYSHMYTDRATADIFKYFDDSKVMYDALWHSPLDYLKMVTGIGNDTAYFSAYYNDMNHWYRAYETTSYNDNHTIIRFNAVVRLFSFGFYHVHTLVMNFISFVGLVYLYK